MMSITPGWSAEVGGVTLSYELSRPQTATSPGVLAVTGTGGDDRLVVSEDAEAPKRLRFDLNGNVYTVDLADLSNSLSDLVVDGGAGDDVIASRISYTFAACNYTYSEPGATNTLTSWSVYLKGGDGNDALQGGSAAHSLWGEAGDDLLVAGDGRTFMLGGDGSDTLYGHGYALDGHGDDPSYDLLNGGPGDDVIHGGAMGWALAGEGDDLVFDGYAATLGIQLPVQSFDWTVPVVKYTAGDPLLGGAAGVPAALVGDVLVINGTAGDDAVSIAVSGPSATTLSVTINGNTLTFDRAAVRSYLFDTRGGHDTLVLPSDNGACTLPGWTVRSANPDDVVDVQRRDTLSLINTMGERVLTPTVQSPGALAEARRAERKAVVAARRAERQARRAEARLRRQMLRDARNQLPADSTRPAAVPLPVATLFSSVLVAAHAPGEILMLLA